MSNPSSPLPVKAGRDISWIPKVIISEFIKSMKKQELRERRVERNEASGYVGGYGPKAMPARVASL